MQQQYIDKSANYFDHTRRDIAPALPSQCGDVLEIGCGTGSTLSWLRQRAGTGRTTGIEMSADAAEIAAKQIDEIHCINFETSLTPPSIAAFDTVLCLDVLEHMVNPWAVVDRIVTQHLRPGGRLIATVPNIRHHTVLLPLLLTGRWRYENAGIMDRTHLRFFSRSTAIDLLTHPALATPNCEALSFKGNRPKILFNRITLGMVEGLITPQYLLHADKSVAP